MALLWWTCPSSSFSAPPLQSNNYYRFPTPLISKALTPNNSSSPSISILHFTRHQSLQRVYSGTPTTTNSSYSVENESNISASNGVFIKGLPESATEGRLKKVFSQFGQVSQVKVVVEKMSMQPLGSAFVWFTSTESAQLAVEEMNGKFFDGRFILVKIAEPGLSKSRGKRARYRF